MSAANRRGYVEPELGFQQAEGEARLRARRDPRGEFGDHGGDQRKTTAEYAGPP